MSLRNLGVYAGIMLKLVEAYHDIGNDIAAFHAPSGCYESAYAGYNRMVVSMLKTMEYDTGYTPVELIAMIEARTTARWVHHSGIWMIRGIWQDHLDGAQERLDKLRRRQVARLPGGFGPMQLACKKLVWQRHANARAVHAMELA